MMKRPILAVCIAIATALFGAPVLAQDLMEKAINPPAADNWTVFGSGESHKMIRDDAVPGGYAFTVTIPSKGANPWDVQAGINVPKAVHKDDVLLFAFWGRAVTAPAGSQTVHINGRMQEGHAPYAAIGEQALDLTSGWKLYYVSGTAQRDFAEGETSAGLHLATGAQTVALGPVFILDFGPGYDLDKLPKN